MLKNLAHDEQSIIALCTPRGAGALALIRLTGTDAVAIADCIAKLPSKKKLADMPTHTIHYGTVIDANSSAIDQVLFLLMRGPKTFTGHDTVEITCHNNPHIIETIINLAITSGARHAQPGEFTRRAVLNNKIDIIQAEAINELIAAQTLTATKQALSQVSGSLSAQLGEVERRLLKSLMFCEATFEFLDEENVSFDDSIQTEINQALTLLSRLEKSFDAQEILRQGVRVALIGSVNAGKSSLFNALLGRERAIVTPIAGTTRDVIESTITRDGFQMTLVDTAGLRTTDDVIEQEGIRRSHQEAALADIVLLVRDGSQMLTDQEATLYKDLEDTCAAKCITVATKADLLNKIIINKSSPALSTSSNSCNSETSFAVNNTHPQTSTFNKSAPINISNTTGLGIVELEDLIQEKITARMNTSDAPFLVTKRQQTLLSETIQRLNDVNALLRQAPVAHELISHQLRDTLALLGECTGKTISEASMDAIFKTFCVGK
jgi:tRNA modification GTPase